jgi:tetratricopeptide (TPR) repeat protein
VLGLLDRMDSTEFPELRERLRSVVGGGARAPVTSSRTADSFGELLAEATRLAQLADVDAVERILDRLTQASDLTIQQRGWLEGTRANALQNAGRHDEAVAAYDAAGEMLERAGDADAAATAAIQRTVSLRLGGRVDEAEEALRDLVDAAPSREHVVQARTTLANTLLERAQDGEHVDLDLLAEARSLLSAAAEQTVENEARGLALVNLANVHLLADDEEEAAATLREAVQYLRRSNSRHLDLVEQHLAALEA